MVVRPAQDSPPTPQKQPVWRAKMAELKPKSIWGRVSRLWL
jgi:hypothetical protein